MLIQMHPTYTMRIVICDYRPEPQHGIGVGQQFAAQAGVPPHKFFGGMDGATGCDAALEAVRDALKKAGLNANVTFEKFEHSGR